MLLLQVLPDSSGIGAAPEAANPLPFLLGALAVFLLLIFLVSRKTPAAPLVSPKLLVPAPPTPEPLSPPTTSSTGPTSPPLPPESKLEPERLPTNPKPPIEPTVTVAPPPPPEPPRSKIKYIGYDPTNVFAQTEPVAFPYVLTPPKLNCPIKFPRTQRRGGRRGHKEAEFFACLERHFRQAFGVHNDQFLLVKGTQPYEPDFTLIDEKNGLNLFLDVEIDEPYEGTNDIATRQPLHYQLADTNRNNAFRNRGWVVVRFAEIQVHKQPDSCCRFLAEVVASLNRSFEMPPSLAGAPHLQKVAQWTREEAEEMSRQKYREQYLGLLTGFGEIPVGPRSGTTEDELGRETETLIIDEPTVAPPPKTVAPPLTLDGLISEARQAGKFLAFEYEGKPTVVKPGPVNPATRKLLAYCYVKNADREFDLSGICQARLKPNFYTARTAKPDLTPEAVRLLVQGAIRNGKYIRMNYTNSSFGGEQGEVNTRTISNVQRSTDVLSVDKVATYKLTTQGHLTAHCHKREDERTFHYDRINELAILTL